MQSGAPASLALERERSGSPSGVDFCAWLGGLAIIEPLVGVVWQRALGQCLGIPVEAHYSLLLGLSLWLVYVADRWLDAWTLTAGVPAAARHRFAREHKLALAAAWCAVLALDVAVAVFTLNSIEWLTRAGLLLATFGYFASVHGRVAKPPKELLVTAIYTAGVSVFAWPLLGWPWAWSPGLLSGTLAFALLALLNLATIAVAETALDRAQGFPSLGQRRQGLAVTVDVAGIALAATSAVAACVAGPFQSWFAAVAGSALTLWILGRVRQRCRPDHFHLAADMALLVPLLLPWT